jgi:hypothetical protein
MSRIVAYTPDVMDRSKIAAAGDCVFVSRPADLTALCAGADVVVVDLTRPGVIDVLPSLEGRVVGFANHTSRDVMEAARAAGCAEVLPRSDFFARINELLSPSQP